jgi:hypothetical protein
MAEIDDWSDMWKDMLDGSITVDSRDLFNPEKINTYDVKVEGWLVLDDSNDLWFFPGKDNKPVKENGEWVGICPFHIEDENHGIVKNELKREPKFIVLKS